MNPSKELKTVKEIFLKTTGENERERTRGQNERKDRTENR
jgi:hypothetical protein